MPLSQIGLATLPWFSWILFSPCNFCHIFIFYNIYQHFSNIFKYLPGAYLFNIWLTWLLSFVRTRSHLLNTCCLVFSKCSINICRVKEFWIYITLHSFLTALFIEIFRSFVLKFISSKSRESLILGEVSFHEKYSFSSQNYLLNRTKIHRNLKLWAHW